MGPTDGTPSMSSNTCSYTDMCMLYGAISHSPIGQQRLRSRSSQARQASAACQCPMTKSTSDLGLQVWCPKVI